MLVQLNLILLMVVAFLPFPTRLLAEFIGASNAERVATTVFGINLLLTAVLVWVLWRYAVHARLVRPGPDMTDEDLKTLNSRLAPSVGAYVVMIVLGLFVPVVAVFGYLAIAVFILVPFRATRTGRLTPEYRSVLWIGPAGHHVRMIWPWCCWPCSRGRAGHPGPQGGHREGPRVGPSHPTRGMAHRSEVLGMASHQTETPSVNGHSFPPTGGHETCP
ncbi:hypothetical protein FXW78_46340 [Rhodococcus opacus]|nr:hypothetical protein [Rhodococcus opacus]